MRRSAAAGKRSLVADPRKPGRAVARDRFDAKRGFAATPPPA